MVSATSLQPGALVCVSGATPVVHVDAVGRRGSREGLSVQELCSHWSSAAPRLLLEVKVTWSQPGPTVRSLCLNKEPSLSSCALASGEPALGALLSLGIWGLSPLTGPLVSSTVVLRV